MAKSKSKKMVEREVKKLTVYSFPQYSISIEAGSRDEAKLLLKQRLAQTKGGD